MASLTGNRHPRVPAPASAYGGEVLDLLPLYPGERTELLTLLRDLTPAEWDAPTECPAWTVKGIALHILGDDLSLLSRQRDEAPPGVVVDGTDNLFAGVLDRFNEQWVSAATFFSPDLLIDLLERTGEWTHRWYTDVDPERLGEPVWFVSPDPAPYWMLAAREYAERWVHQWQIRRAVGRPGLAHNPYTRAATAVVTRGFAQGFAVLPAPPGTTIAITLADAAWTLERDADRWTLTDGAPADPTVHVVLDDDTAGALFSRGLTADEAQARLTIEGDEQLGGALRFGLAAFFAPQP
jgi:uncharacterized protein (TIGR03083 family)